MKWFKAVLIAVPAFFTATALTVFPVNIASAMYYYSWKWFWNAVLELLIEAAKIYLDQVRTQGHWRVSMQSAPLVALYQGNPGDATLAAEKGMGFSGNTLTVTHDILIYNDGRTGVALKQGEYSIDPEGNFQFDLITVDNPVPSSTFPLPL